MPEQRGMGSDAQQRLTAACAIFSKYGTVIQTMIRSHIRDTSLAEDIYQDLFLSIVKKPVPADHDAPLFYLWRAVANDVRDAVRKSKNYNRALRRYVCFKVRCSNENDNPLSILERREIQNQLVDIVNSVLRPHEAKAVTSRYICNMSNKETAEKVNVNPRTLSRYLCTGMGQLRRTLKKSNYAMSDFLL